MSSSSVFGHFTSMNIVEMTGTNLCFINMSIYLDISQSRAVGPVQPNLAMFPRTPQGKKSRAFNSTWYKEYPWIEYSQSQNSAHCFVCRHFSLPSAPQSAFTSSSGFANWKKALYKDGGFAMHSKSEHHVNAMLAWSDYKRGAESNTSLLKSINKDYQKRVKENRDYIKTVADVLLLTATQNIPQRGHRESEESENRGNFLAILEQIAKRDPIVKKKLSSGNAKYTSNTTQKEILECLAEMVRQNIIQEVKENEAFSVLVDETKDMKKKNKFPWS